MKWNFWVFQDSPILSLLLVTIRSLFNKSSFLDTFFYSFLSTCVCESVCSSSTRSTIVHTILWLFLLHCCLYSFLVVFFKSLTVVFSSFFLSPSLSLIPFLKKISSYTRKVIEEEDKLRNQDLEERESWKKSTSVQQ